MEIIVGLKKDLTEQEIQNIIYLIDNMYGVENISINIKTIEGNIEDIKGLSVKNKEI